MSLGQLSAPRLVNYGDVFAKRTSQHVNKLMDIENKKKELADKRAYNEGIAQRNRQWQVDDAATRREQQVTDAATLRTHQVTDKTDLWARQDANKSALWARQDANKADLWARQDKQKADDRAFSANQAAASRAASWKQFLAKENYKDAKEQARIQQASNFFKGRDNGTPVMATIDKSVVGYEPDEKGQRKVYSSSGKKMDALGKTWKKEMDKLPPALQDDVNRLAFGSKKDRAELDRLIEEHKSNSTMPPRVFDRITGNAITKIRGVKTSIDAIQAENAKKAKQVAPKKVKKTVKQTDYGTSISNIDRRMKELEREASDPLTIGNNYIKARITNEHKDLTNARKELANKEAEITKGVLKLETEREKNVENLRLSPKDVLAAKKAWKEDKKVDSEGRDISFDAYLENLKKRR